MCTSSQWIGACSVASGGRRKEGVENVCDKIFGLSGLQLAEAAA